MIAFRFDFRKWYLLLLLAFGWDAASFGHKLIGE